MGRTNWDSLKGSLGGIYKGGLGYSRDQGAGSLKGSIRDLSGGVGVLKGSWGLVTRAINKQGNHIKNYI